MGGWVAVHWRGKGLCDVWALGGGVGQPKGVWCAGLVKLGGFFTMSERKILWLVVTL